MIAGAMLAQIGLFAVKPDGSSPTALEYDPELTDSEFAAFVKDGRDPHLPLPPAVPLMIERLERALDDDNPSFFELVDGARIQTVRDLLTRELGKAFASRNRLPPITTVNVETISVMCEGGGQVRRHRFAYSVRRSGIIAYGAVGLGAPDRERTYVLKQTPTGWRVEDMLLSPAQPNR